ncbi:hypothetical protein ES703_122308 [subsurface metagenome]
MERKLVFHKTKELEEKLMSLSELREGHKNKAGRGGEKVSKARENR